METKSLYGQIKTLLADELPPGAFLMPEIPNLNGLFASITFENPACPGWFLYDQGHRLLATDGSRYVRVNRVVEGEHACASLASRLLAVLSMYEFEWKKCPHDKLKEELFFRGEKLQAIWKIDPKGHHWGGYTGDVYNAKNRAIVGATHAAQRMIRSRNDERISRLTAMC